MMRSRLISLLAVLLSFASHELRAEANSVGSPAESIRAVRATLEAQRDRSAKQDTIAWITAELELGNFKQVEALLPALQHTDGGAATQVRLQLALETYQFEFVDSLLAELKNAGLDTSVAVRELSYEWLFIRSNLAAIDSLTHSELSEHPKDVTALLARGRMFFEILEYDSALAYFDRVIPADVRQPGGLEFTAGHASPGGLSQAIHGIGKVLQKQNDHQTALDTLTTLINPYLNTDEDVWFDLGYSLIDLARVSEAIGVFEEILQWNPLHEKAHYFLGNGYARLNYTQLAEKYPTELANPKAQTGLQKAIVSFTNGNVERAELQAVRVHEQYSRAVQPPAFIASLRWSQGRYDEAAEWFQTALTFCSEYGRAHSGLARTLETKRLRVSIHRERADSILNATPTPDVPRIDEYVLNWKSLSARHQKQVALAVEPWKLYVPLLVESGHHHYIKPLHEQLSESPGLETLKDQRISYDSRLWDDVRGCGGYTTVTGIEDVERSIYWSYNTVLHELTHQVHGVFPPEDAQKLVDAYHVSRNFEQAGTKVFMSQYQSASVWEYFAEGANGYYSPRRDAYDTREIVRERLLTLDTVLVRLVEYYVMAPNLDACYPVALVNAADDHIERNEIPPALILTLKAFDRAPQADVVLSELSYIYSLRNEDQKALAFAESLRVHYPTKAEAFTRGYYARYFADGDARLGAEGLRQGLTTVDSTERKAVRQTLGNALWYAGDYAGAAKQYQDILDVQTNESDALWGLGLARGDAGQYAEADSAFQKALLERSGIAELRLDYARILLMTNRIADAETQVHEADLLTPNDPAVITMQGWVASAKGEWTQALAAYNRAIKDAPHDRLPAVLRIEALRHAGQEKRAAKEFQRLTRLSEADVPAWIYVKQRSAFTTGYAWPKYLRILLAPFGDDDARSIR